jgi:predicted dehydrogenase
MAERKLRIGIAGCGAITREAHIPAWLANEESVEVVAVADPTAANLEAARDLLGLDPAMAYEDPFDLLRRAEIDVLDVCSPPGVRRELMLEAAARGKDIFCEKPLATVPREAADVVEACTKAGIKLGCVHSYAFMPEIRAASRVVESGEIGEVRSVIVNYLGIPAELPGDPAYAPRWRYDVDASGGGVLMDIIHGVYLANQLLGTEFQRASAFIENRDPRSNVEDLALARFEGTESAALVNIGTGFGAGGIEVGGTEGRVSVIYEDNGTWPWSEFERVLVTIGEETRAEFAAGDAPKDDVPSWLVPFIDLAAEFAEACLEDEPPRFPGIEGLHVLEAAIAAYKSGATGESVGVPLQRDDPMFLKGAVGVADLDLPSWSPVQRSGLFLPRRALETGAVDG